HGEHDLRPALKKRAAELSFKGGHGIGQRGLRHPAAAGCPREIALLAQRQEVADLLHLHGRPHPYHWPSMRGCIDSTFSMVRQFTQPRFSALVARFNQIEGYRCLSLIRALAVVKCQSALAWFALRSCSQAATSSMRSCLSGMRRSRHWDDRTPSSDSARSSQLPCFGV